MRQETPAESAVREVVEDYFRPLGLRSMRVGRPELRDNRHRGRRAVKIMREYSKATREQILAMLAHIRQTPEPPEWRVSVFFVEDRLVGGIATARVTLSLDRQILNVQIDDGRVLTVA